MAEKSRYAYPILHEIGSCDTNPKNLEPKGRMNLTAADLKKAVNGAFICLREPLPGTKRPIETYAAKINGVLFPTCETRARALPGIAFAFGGTTQAWCKAWSLVNLPPFNKPATNS